MNKPVTITLLILLVTSYSYAQIENWKVLTTSTNLKSINYLSDNNIWIFGGYYSYNSNNGGESWSLPILQQHNFDISFRTINFVDSLYGWIYLHSNTVLKTTNGGNV